MVYVCAVPGCYRRRKKEEKISFHCFPSDLKRCEVWIEKISRENIDGSQWMPSKFSRVCSEHFLYNDYVSGTLIRTLKDTAVPTLLPLNPPHKRQRQTRSQPLLALQLPQRNRTNSKRCQSPSPFAQLPVQTSTDIDIKSHQTPSPSSHSVICREQSPVQFKTCQTPSLPNVKSRQTRSRPPPTLQHPNESPTVTDSQPHKCSPPPSPSVQLPQKFSTSIKSCQTHPRPLPTLQLPRQCPTDIGSQVCRSPSPPSPSESDSLPQQSPTDSTKSCQTPSPPSPTLPLPQQTPTNSEPSEPQKVAMDHAYAGLSVEEALQKAICSLAEANSKLMEKRKEVKLLKRKVQRRDVQLSSLTKVLKSKQLLTSEQVNLLKLNIDKLC